MVDPETRPSVGKDVHQDLAGGSAAPLPTSMRPSANLVTSDKYNGKAVYGAEDKKVGCDQIRAWSIRPAASRPMPCCSIGGILGMGAEHYPVPWRLLGFDSKLDGYRSDISGNRLKGYPKSVFGSSGSELFDWTAKRAELNSYYDNVDTVTTKEAEESPLTRSTG